MSRHDKITEAIRKEISMILHRELKDPRLGFVTITRVELTQDLRIAKVFFSVLGKEEDYKKTKEALDSALGFIRRLIAQRINLRFTPEVVFKEDKSSEYSVRIQEILNEINPVRNTKFTEMQNKISNRVKELNEPKKSRRLHKKV